MASIIRFKNAFCCVLLTTNLLVAIAHRTGPCLGGLDKFENAGRQEPRPPECCTSSLTWGPASSPWRGGHGCVAFNSIRRQWRAGRRRSIAGDRHRDRDLRYHLQMTGRIANLSFGGRVHFATCSGAGCVGIMGHALLSVPILVIVKVVSQNINGVEQLHPAGRAVGRLVGITAGARCRCRRVSDQSDGNQVESHAM